MKAIGARIHMKGVPRRVSTVSTGRCIHGLPCSLPVAWWTLLLLLLLSSSFSHVQETGEREEAAVGTREYNLDGVTGSADRLDNTPLDRKFVSDRSSSLPTEGASKHDTELNSLWALDDSRAQGIAQISGTPLDALQYAEYGAGLLQKSGVAEASSKICLVGNPRGVYCPVLMEPKHTLGSDCGSSSENLPCTNEFLAEELCQTFNNYLGRSTEELIPEGNYILCRKNPLSGAVFCEASCSSISQCVPAGVDSKTCHYSSSLADLFPFAPEMHKGPAKPQPSTTEYSVDGGINNGAIVDLRRHLVIDATEERSDALSDEMILRQSDQNLWQGDDSRNPVETDIQQSAELIVVQESKPQAELSKDAFESSLETSDQSDVQNQSMEDNNIPPVEVSNGRSKLEQSGLVSYSRVGRGEIRVDVDEALFEELHSMMQFQEEGEPFSKLPTSTGVEIEKQLEPAKLRRVGSVLTLDEYKKSISEKQNLSNDVYPSNVQTHKMRHSDESYNYAGNSHGAKVLASNKEAKGAGHIINSDKDKYLRNPCSAEDKHVVLELSEETFVDTVVVSNFEFHSANLKDFEVYGSPVYPTKEWVLLGRFQAENVRHRQKFTIEDPKLVRYLMLKMISHWGSEFFCTLSAVEVFGVDVIKNLLDDWIAREDESGPRAPMNGISHQEENTAELVHRPLELVDLTLKDPSGAQLSGESGNSPEPVGSGNKEKKGDAPAKEDDPKGSDPTPEVHHLTGGKPPGDSVLKILMHKVKALEANQSLFDHYLEDLNAKYKAMLSELDKDLALMSERLRNETAISALLALRLADMEMKRREDRAYFEQTFALVAINFTENIEFMRWQIQSMERREITAVMLAFVGMILSAMLHVLAHCLLRRRGGSSPDYTSQKDEVTEMISPEMDNCKLHSVCTRSSSVILYLASGLTILVLSV